MQKLFKDFFVVNRRKRKYKEKNRLSLFLNLKQQSMILQLAFVLTAIIIGARLGGIGLGVMGGVGLAILTFVFGLQPTAPPIDVMLMINLCRFLHAGSRRFGLYGETGRTFAS